MKSHIVALQETRLNEWSQRELAKEAKGKGWSLLCGRPQPKPMGARVNSWRAKHGGVGLLVRDGIRAFVPSNDTPLRQRLWDSG
eukprot:4075071-Karenia_brevis.AAC.1